MAFRFPHPSQVPTLSRPHSHLRDLLWSPNPSSITTHQSKPSFAAHPLPLERTSVTHDRPGHEQIRQSRTISSALHPCQPQRSLDTPQGSSHLKLAVLFPNGRSTHDIAAGPSLNIAERTAFLNLNVRLHTYVSADPLSRTGYLCIPLQQFLLLSGLGV